MKEYDTQAVISALSAELKQVSEVSMPEWAKFVKTGVARTGPPTNPDWWYVRSASILRKIAVIGPIGVNKLRRHYGGKNRLGYAPAHFERASGKIIRVVLQQLEKAGLVKQIVVSGHKGRVLDTKGSALVAKAIKASRASAKTESTKAEAPKKESKAKVEETPVEVKAEGGEE